MSPRVVVIGGGIAGISVAHFLAKTCNVTLVEQEALLASHSTGRSAALYFENYGATANRPLSRISRRFFENPPAEVDRHPFLTPRGALWIGTPEQEPALRETLAASAATPHPGRWLAPRQAQTIVPVLRPEYLGGAVFEPEALDLDVAALHQAFVRAFRKSGGEIVLSAPVVELKQTGTTWLVQAGAHQLEADKVVNAAGAWGDRVAVLAGARPIGLEPRRRTAFMVPGNLAFREWPLTCDVDNHFYFRPDGSQLLCSLAEENLSDPEDARPDELDIALAIDRINRATSLEIRTVRSAWTGLENLCSRSSDGDRIRSGGRGILVAGGAGRNRDPNRSGRR